MDGICAEQCDTCIFRDGNKMRLRKGRVKAMCAETDARDTNVICHKSKSVSGDLNVDLFCKGSVDRRPGQMARIMYRLGCPEIDPNDTAIRQSE